MLWYIYIFFFANLLQFKRSTGKHLKFVCKFEKKILNKNETKFILYRGYLHQRLYIIHARRTYILGDTKILMHIESRL